MKSFSLLFVLLFSWNLSANAQLFSEEEIAQFNIYTKFSYKKNAKDIEKEYKLNEENELVVRNIYEYPGKSKTQLYDIVYNWVINTLSKTKTTILVNDIEGGHLNIRCLIPNIASNDLVDHTYYVSIYPLIKFDFKENRMRITYFLHDYDITTSYLHFDNYYNKNFEIVAMHPEVKNDISNWQIEKCYPYDYKDTRPITSSMALINTIACFKLINNKIDYNIINNIHKKNDDSDSDNDNW